MSKITTHLTQFERPDLFKAALDSMGVPYQEQAPIPNNPWFRGRADFAIDGQAFGMYRGLGYTFNSQTGSLYRQMDHMDMSYEHGQEMAPEAIRQFETELHNHYNLALMMEMLAQGNLEVQQTVLEDGSIVLDVNDHNFGG